MTTLATDATAVDVWCDDDTLWVRLADGRQLGVPLVYFPRLLRATPEQRNRWELSGGGRGIHWEEVDEDVSVAGLLAGRRDQSKTARPAPGVDTATR